MQPPNNIKHIRNLTLLVNEMPVGMFHWVWYEDNNKFLTIWHNGEIIFNVPYENISYENFERNNEKTLMCYITVKALFT